jgi:hypothetical protein
MSDGKVYAIIIMIMVAGLAASYGLALAGEPQSAWLWCRVLRFC